MSELLRNLMMQAIGTKTVGEDPKKRERGFLNRFRLEQRWITTVEYGTEYSNRIRYMLGFTIPLNGTKIEKGTNFITVFDEVFIDLDRFDYWFDREAGESGLNQNRLYAGYGRQLTNLSNFRVGILWQHRPNVNFYRLILSYAHNLNFTKI